jgi:peptide chain release factor 1
MIAKLEQVEARFEELNEQLADPAVMKDPNRLKELSREHRDVERVVAAYRDLKKVRSDLAGNHEIIESESDGELVAMAKEEIAALEAREEELAQALKLLLLPKDPNDGKNVVLEIRSGTGGDEAALFAGDLFRMYLRYAELKGWKTEVLSASEGAKGGYKEVIALLTGDDVYSSMKFESGVHRVQRVPETESQGRVHTSAATVAVLPEAEDADVEISPNEIRIDVFRSSGPGGQSVNTTDSAVRITHEPTGIVVSCQDEKSQHKNKAKALKILRSRLLDKLQAEQQAEAVAARRSMVKSGDRSEKIRTYNFPQDRLTDHRIGLTTHNLPKLLDGGLEDVVTALRTHYQAEALKGESS